MSIRAPESTSPPNEPSSYDVDMESGVLFEFEDAMRTHGCVRVIADCTKQTTFAWTAYDNKVSHSILFQTFKTLTGRQFYFGSELNFNHDSKYLWICHIFTVRVLHGIRSGSNLSACQFFAKNHCDSG